VYFLQLHLLVAVTQDGQTHQKQALQVDQAQVRLRVKLALLALLVKATLAVMVAVLQQTMVLVEVVGQLQ
jgi:hypothetical protein